MEEQCGHSALNPLLCNSLLMDSKWTHGSRPRVTDEKLNKRKASKTLRPESKYLISLFGETRFSETEANQSSQDGPDNGGKQFAVA